MKRSGALLAACAAIGLVGAAGAAVAQTPSFGSPAGATRTIQVPAGAVVLVLPNGAVASPDLSDAAFGPIGFPALPDVDVMFRQIDAMMASAQQAFAMPGMMSQDRTIEAAMRDMPAGGSSVMVSSFSDGRHSCTQRVTYTGNGAAPVIQTSGDACGAMTRPAAPVAEPEVVAPHQALPRTIQALNNHRVAPKPIELAQLAR